MTEATEMLGWIGGAFLLGVAGSGHCVGMCGGIASALGLASRREDGAPSRAAPLLHGAGRVATYGLIGLVLGGFGHATHVLLGLGPWLRAAAGLLVVLFGLQLLGFRVGIDRIERVGLVVWRRIAPLTARVRGGSAHPGRAFALGGLWGLLPCGLVYSAAAAATATGSALAGAAFMLAFGLGTLPALVLGTGLVVGGFGARLRRPAVRRLAGAFMVLLGCVSIWAVGGAGHAGHDAGSAPHSAAESPAAPDRHGHGVHVRCPRRRVRRAGARRHVDLGTDHHRVRRVQRRGRTGRVPE